MADEIIIETVSAEVIEVGVVGPQGPKGDKGDPGDVAGLPLTTQGDTLYRGASSNARLPIGQNSQVLKVVNGLPAWANESGAVTSVNGESGAVTLDGSEIDSSGNDVRAAFTMTSFSDGDGIYYPLPDQFINTKPIYRTTSGYSVFFENSRWHIADGSPNTQNIIESSDNDNAAFPWLSAWSGDVEKAKLADVVGRARSTFLFLGDNIPNTSVSGLATVAASGDYDDLAGKPASFTPSAHSSTHHTGGTDAIAPNQISAAWAPVLSTQGISGDTVLSAGRNRRIGVGSTSTNTANITLPFSGNQAGDIVTLVGVSVGPPFSSTYTIRLAGAFDGSGNPVGYSNLATLNALGQSFTFVSDGSAAGWSLRAVDTHTHTFGTTAGTFTQGNDTRLSDSRDPNLHSASHAAAGSDPLAPSDIGAQSIFATDSASASVSGVPLQLSSARAKTWTLENAHSNRDVYLPVTGIQAGDVAVLIGGGTMTYTLTVKVPAAGGAAIIDPENTPNASPVVIGATGQQFRFIVTNPASFNPWRFVSVDTHTHIASAISDSTTAGRALLTGADAAAQRTSLGLGTAATSATGDFAAASHAHGNLTNDGKLGSTAGLPVVTTTAGAVTTLALGAAGTVLTVNSGATGVEFAAASGGGSGGTKTYAVFTATDNQPPATAFATLDTRNSIAVLDFDAATDENAVFVGIMPEAASLNSGLIVRLHWLATTATSGNVRWGVQLERSNTDLDADSFDTAVEATAATNGTSGILTTTAITVTNIDGITAGDVFRLKVFRNADDATNDTMTGDAELAAVEVRSAA